MPLSGTDVRRALEELSRLRFGVADVEDAMRDIVRTTHSLFEVDGAALMLTDAEHQLRVAADSDARIAHLEELQLTHHEGPCLDAFRDGEVVRSEDLLTEHRWPVFGPAAAERGLCAVLASPIPFQQRPIGVVVVVSCTRRPWTPEAELGLVAFTDLAALLIATTLYAEEQSELAARLQDALTATRLLDRAASALAEREGVSPRAAHQRLRAMARQQHRTLAEIAADVVTNAAP